MTTFGVGGPARWFVRAEAESDVAEAVEWARERGVPLFVLGGGSNLLVADRGFEGLVLQVAVKGIRADSPLSAEGRVFEAAAGEDWDAFVDRTLIENCAGVECLAGIPGTVGGTPVQNVGAYGQEVANTIETVRAYDVAEGATVELTADECGFSYRRSRFNSADRGRFVILSVRYRLQPGGAPLLKYADVARAFGPDAKPTLLQVASAVREIRRSKGMLLVEGDADCRSAGSFFKNPVASGVDASNIGRIVGSEPPCFPAGAEFPDMVKISAAWLIEKAGFAKGCKLGRAGISSKHTLALVNLGGASAAEILALASEIRSAVSGKFGIDLQMEPVLLGF